MRGPWGGGAAPRHNATLSTLGDAAKTVAASTSVAASATSPARTPAQRRINSPTSRTSNGSAAAPTRHHSAGTAAPYHTQGELRGNGLSRSPRGSTSLVHDCADDREEEEHGVQQGPCEGHGPGEKDPKAPVGQDQTTTEGRCETIAQDH